MAYNFTAEIYLSNRINGMAAAQRAIRNGLRQAGITQLTVELSPTALRNLTTLENRLRQIATQGRATAQTISQIGTTTGGLPRLGQAVRATTNDMDGFGRSIGFATKRYAAFLTAAGSGVLLFHKIRQGLQSSIEFETGIARIGAVSNQSISQLQGLAQQIRAVGKSMGVSSAEITAGLETLVQAGFTNASEFINLLAKARLSPTFGKDVSKISDALVLGREAFKFSELKQYEQLLSDISILSAILL